MPTLTKKRAPTPEELGLLEDDVPPAAPSVKRSRAPSPEELGLVDEPPPPTRPPARKGPSPSPEALGLVPLGAKPMTQPPAHESSWSEWWDWATDEVAPVTQAAGEAGDWIWQGVRDTLGITPAPEPYHQDTSRRVARPDMTQDSGLIDQIIDYAVPDAIYDFATSKRTQQNLDIGYAHAQRNLGDLLKGMTYVGQRADEFMSDIGLDLDYWNRSDEEKAQAWEETRANLETIQKSYDIDAQRGSEQLGERSLLDALTQVVPSLPTMFAEYGLAGAAFGAAGGFAFIDGMHAAGAGGNKEDVALAAAKGAAMGKILDWLNVLSRPLRVAIIAPGSYALAKAEGADNVDALANSIVFTGLGALPQAGPINMRYLRENGIGADVRDIGGHLRDLFIGGNASRAEADFNQAGKELGEVRSRHAQEVEAENARWKQEQEEAKVAREGDDENSAGDRLSAANARHEMAEEDFSKRHYDEELPYRQAYDHAERRHNRAKNAFLNPFGPSWQEAPYMRSLHMYERDVVVATVNAINAVKQGQDTADERKAYGAERAAALRERAAAEEDPEARAKLETMARIAEDHAFRISYEFKSRAELASENMIQTAEARASIARYELAKIIGHGNRTDGRRALQLATMRDLEDAYRAGLRVISYGNRRARELLAIADDVVTRTEAHMKESGVEKDSETWVQNMDTAHQIAEQYRNSASVELWDAQNTADTRLSFANAAHEASMNPHPRAGIINDILEFMGLKKKAEKPKNEDAEETTADDARKEDTPDWDKREEDTVELGPDFESRYKALMIHSQKDPKLGVIQNELDRALGMITKPEDVLPLINYIAKKNGYDSPSRRGKQTAKLRKELAKKLGMTEEEFLDSPYGKAFNDFELEAVLEILDRQWARTQRAYDVYRASPSSNALMAYQAELYRFMMIWERLQGAAAEAGRALRMFREIKSRYGSATKPMTTLQYDMIMNGDSVSAMRMMKAFNRGGWIKALMEYYMANLLSGPQTAMVNILSGIGMIAIDGVTKPAMAAMVGAVRMIVGTTFGKFLIKPMRAVFRALIKIGGSAEAKKRLALKQERELDDFNGYEDAWSHRNRIRFGEVGARLRGIMEGIVPGAVAFVRSLFYGERLFNSDTYARGLGEHIPWWLGGNIIRIPFKILSAIDDFFKAIMYRSAIRGHAYRLAMAEYQYTGHGWKDIGARRARYQSLVRHPEAYIMHLAEMEAKQLTFQNDLDPMWAGVPGFIEKTPLLKVLVPFSRTLLNSLEWVMSGTPVGAFAFKRTRESLMGMRGRAAQDMAIAHVLFVSGTSTLMFLWALADGGNNIAAPYPKNEKDRTMSGLNQIPPLAVRIPGTKEYIQLNRIDPIGAIIALGSSAANAYKVAVARGDKKAAERSWSIFLGSMFSMITDRSGFKGMLDFIQAMQGGQSGQETGSWERWTNRLGATLAVPNVVASWARTRDPIIRRADTLLENIMARVPGEREKLPPVRTLWGDQLVGYDSYGDNDILDYVSPVYWGRKTDDNATRLMQDIYSIYDWAPGQLRRKIAGRDLTREEYDFLQVATGKRAYQYITDLYHSPDWQRCLELDARIKAIREEYRGNIHKPIDEERRKALRAEYKQLINELRPKRYKVYQQAKDLMRRARREGRLDTFGKSDGKTRGAFPDFWDRERDATDAQNTGEVPDYTPGWLDNFMHGETPRELWDAEDERDSEQFGQDTDPAFNRALQENLQFQAKNKEWIEKTRKVQAENAERIKRGLPPLPLPPRPPQ